MDTQPVLPPPTASPPPAILSQRLLLSDSTPVVPLSLLAPKSLTLRAATVSVLLAEMLDHSSYHHGGLNE